MIGFLSLCFILLPTLVFAAPAVTGISGTVSNGESITISGTDFGATGPTIILFDDFDSGTENAYIGDGITSAIVGSWEDCGENCTPVYYSTYSTIQKHSGAQSARQNWATDNQEGARWMGAVISSPVTAVYFSFWTYLPAGQNVPGTSGGLGANWKVWWLQRTSSHADDYASEIVTDPPSETSICYVDGTTNRACWGYGSFSFTKGRWLRWEGYLTASTSAGNVYLWNTDSGQARNLVGSASGRTIDDGSTGWLLFRIPGFARADSNSNTYYDDVYVSSGSGALARVEICNNATYTSATNCAITTPTSWGATSIAATVRQGSFGASDNAYLFVIDSSGVASSGYAVQFGAGGETPSPRKLQNVTGNRVSLH